MIWSLLQQQTVEVPPFDWGQFLGTSGPLAAAMALLGFLAKIWVDSRKEKREDKKADLEGEVGAVAAARDAVSLVREQMDAMKQEIADMKAQHGIEIAELRAKLEESRKTVDKLNDRVRELETENGYLKGQRGASG